MTTSNLVTGAMVVCAVAIGAAGGYLLAGKDRKTGGHAQMTEHPDTAAPPPEKNALYWYDPMYPQQHFDKPGKSPFMDMQLVPKYASTGDDTNTMHIDTDLTQNFGMRLATVTRGTYAAGINAVGTLAYNERDVAIVQARTNGYVERVYARAPGDLLGAGAPLADILVPEWSAAQTEYLTLIKNGEPALIEAARERLKLLGMSGNLIKRVGDQGKPQAIITITTPIAGVIQTLDVRTGMTVMAGQTLARINGLATIWLDAAVPVDQAGQVRVGARAGARLSAYPGELVTGQVIAVLPEINRDSRTLRVRIELANPDGRFRPGMYAEVDLRAAEQQSVLLVPSEAVIRTGRRTLVMLVENGGRYRPVEVESGHDFDGQTVILNGLEEGQKIVASGQFLIDSEANLKGLSIRPLETK